MAMADYRLCDVCEGKAFYDSNLNHQQGPGHPRWPNGPAYRNAGADQFDTPEKCEKCGMRLDRLGDWAVICADCAKTHRTVVVPIDAAPSGS